MNKLKSYINLHKSEIENRIRETIAQKQSEDLTIPLYGAALTRLLDFSIGGKMLRGLLVLLSAEMFGKNTSDVLNIAAAIELAHSAFLIHDDIIDEDELRRGKKTIYAQYMDGESKFYGQSIAICVGDISFFLSTQLISQSNIGVAEKNMIQDYFSGELIKVAAAEMEDFNFGAKNAEPTMEQILNMYKLKSARYTFSMPLAIGATIGGQDKSIISELEEFGENLGIVFQIVDDALGITGDAQITGKPVGSDIRQNKKTVFRKYLYDLYDNKSQLDSIFGKQMAGEQDIEIIKQIAIDLKIQDKIDSLILTHLNKARQILSQINIPEKYKEYFEELIEYNISRNK